MNTNSNEIIDSTPNETPPKKYLNVREVSKLLGITPSYTYKLISKKEIPHIKFSTKKVLFDSVEIENWVSSKKIAAK